MKGIALPIRATARGGLRLSEGDEQLDKLVAMAILPCPSRNPFQRLGIGQYTFRTITPPLESEIIEDIKDAFRSFEQERRARLLSVSVNKENGELMAEVVYTSLETSRERIVKEKLR